jgi:hypothetical protein
MWVRSLTEIAYSYRHKDGDNRLYDCQLSHVGIDANRRSLGQSIDNRPTTIEP